MEKPVGKNSFSAKILKDEQGKIILIGSLRQIKRRLKTLIRNNKVDNQFHRILQYPELWAAYEKACAGLRQAKKFGYTIADAFPIKNGSLGRLTNSMDKLKAKLKEVPKSPGVYQFKNKDGEVIYVGKAKNLRARIGQYLNRQDERPQIPYLLAEAADFDYTVVNNELESLFLENTLIKQYLPRYNIMLRDDKNYAFIEIDYNCEIPKISYVRKVDKTAKNIRYFGPYSAAYKIRQTLDLARRIFPYCAADKVSSRPCFYYYLHRCPGVCIGKISLNDYRGQLKKIEDFLAGDTGKIKKELEAEMNLASRVREYEKAARLRDQLNSLKLLEERQTVILTKAVSWDIVSIADDQGYACVNLFKIREGKLFDKENFIYEIGRGRAAAPAEADSAHLKSGWPTDAPPSTAPNEILQTFLERYYLDSSNAPKAVYTQMPAADPELIEHIIRSRFNLKSLILNPKKGKPLGLVKLGQTNAREYLKNWLQSQAGHLDKINQALQGLKDILRLEKIPERIECYDISNTQGTNAVGSMVVFEKGLPKKSEYRKFRIRGKRTPDDFAMMREVLTRRLARSIQGAAGREEPRPYPGSSSKTKWPLPDLIVIDGGKGQLAAALEILQKFSIFPASGTGNFQFSIIGLAKRIEEIFVPGQSQPIILSHNDPALQLLQRLRDEAHRFGITYHRNLRSKQAVKSALDDVPGIGPKTKKLLKQKFGTVANIRGAKFEDLAAVVGERVALAIQQML